MVVVESGLKSEGLLERGYEWYVQWIKPVPSALTTLEFNGVLADWKSKVKSYKADAKKASDSPLSKSPADLTIRELVGGLSLRSFGCLLGLVAIVAGAFAIGAKLVGQFKAVHANFGLKIF